jgi:hypothetical protein
VEAIEESIAAAAIEEIAQQPVPDGTATDDSAEGPGSRRG